jgi:GNAT superfamily N-acetyltransferase
MSIQTPTSQAQPELPNGEDNEMWDENSGSVVNNDRLLFKQFTEEIDAFYRERFRYKSRCTNGRFPTVDINRVAVCLYLRFKYGDSWPYNTLVIASISFRDQRRGHGRALLAKLVEMSGRYGYTSIAIEQTSSGESIQSFVRKFGFANHLNSRNWITPVSSLTERLA